MDILLEVPQIQLPGLLDDLARKGFHFDPPTLIREFVRDHITVFRLGPVRIDWLKPVIPLYAHALSGATTLSWTEGYDIRVASAEGIILTKLVASRSQDKVDIETLLAANSETIDIGHIHK